MHNEWCLGLRPATGRGKPSSSFSHWLRRRGAFFFFCFQISRLTFLWVAFLGQYSVYAHSYFEVCPINSKNEKNSRQFETRNCWRSRFQILRQIHPRSFVACWYIELGGNPGQRAGCFAYFAMGVRTRVQPIVYGSTTGRGQTNAEQCVYPTPPLSRCVPP